MNTHTDSSVLQTPHRVPVTGESSAEALNCEPISSQQSVMRIYAVIPIIIGQSIGQGSLKVTALQSAI